MKYICVKCDDEFSYEQAFNAHTHILDRKEDAVCIESVDDVWFGEQCQICHQPCAIKSLSLFKKSSNDNTNRRLFRV